MRSFLDPAIRVVAPDYPGFGESVSDGSGISIADVADSVAEAIRETNTTTVVCGLSLGGYVALALAEHHPDCVQGLVLANTRADADDDAARRARTGAYDTIRIDGFDVWRNESIPRLVRPDPDPSVLETVWTIAAEQNPVAVMHAIEALRDRPSRMHLLSSITVPTAVVGGDEDQVTPHSAIAALSDGIPDATVHIIPGAGHLTAIEQPAAFAEVVRTVCDRVRDAS